MKTNESKGAPPMSMKRDYTAWAKGQDFHTRTVYEREYLKDHNYTCWFTGLTSQQKREQADFERERRQPRFDLVKKVA